MRSRLLFLERFLQHPQRIASVIPSSRFLEDRIDRMIDGTKRRVIVEYGPGTGGVARKLLQPGKLTPDSLLLLIERDPLLANVLRDTIQDIRAHVFCADAQDIDRILKEQGEPHADYILTSIPLSLIPAQDRAHLLRKTSDLLGNDGTFLMWAVRGSMRRDIASVFAEVDAEREWRNVPPLWVFRATKNSPSRHGRLREVHRNNG